MSGFRRKAVHAGAGCGFALAAVSVFAPSAAWADSCANAEFRSGESARLADCRAYEQVSPVVKPGNPVVAVPPQASNSQSASSVTLPPGWANTDGDRLLFNTSVGPGAENADRGLALPQVAERTAQGWSSRPAAHGPRPEMEATAARAAMRLQIPSEDRSQLLFNAGVAYSLDQPPGHQFGNGGINLADPTGAVAWVSQPAWAGADLPPGSEGLELTRFAPVGGSQDFSTVYFMTRQTLTPQDAASGRTWDQSWALYRWKDGVVTNAGVLPDGSVDPGGSMSAGLDRNGSQVSGAGASNLTSLLGNGHVVSSDGDRALFITPGDRGNAAVPQLYLYRHGQPTLLISKEPAASAPVAGSLGTVPVSINSGVAGGTTAATAMMAEGSRDLDVIVFATRDSLVPGAPAGGTRANTYRYRVSTNTLEYLAEFDRPGAAATRGQVGNVYRMSDDGTRILFRTAANELKLWREGQSTITLATGIAIPAAASGGITTARFSKDGKTVIFMSRVAINGAPDHPAGNGPLATQVYRYVEGDAAPTCISCPPADATVRGPAAFDLKSPLSNGFGTSAVDNVAVAQNRGMSDDGTRVFFTTTSTLSSNDQNTKADVYEWSAARGTVELLSSGSPDSRGDYLMDNSGSGDDVFFTTEARLTASDTDEHYDVYTARVGGGLPDPPVEDESVCVPGSCQAPQGPLPPFRGSGSTVLGPVTRGVDDRGLQAAPRSFAVRRSRGSASKVTVGVSVPGAGTIRVSGSGLKTTSRRVKSSNTFTVHARLTAATKRRVARKSVRLKVRVRYTPSSGKATTKTVRVAVKRSTSTKRGGR